MDEYQENRGWESGVNRWLLIGAAAVVVIAVIALGYGMRQSAAVGHLTAQQTAANDTINQLQGQLTAVNGKLNDMVAAQQAAQQAAEQEKAARAARGGRGGAPSDGRYKQLKTQLEDQQKQLKDTQDLVAKNRTDLETNLSSTKDELNGSIARTHEELVVLQKRGERNYFEFDLTKAKQFQRIGPLTLSLRHTDAKHMNYDLAMVVDDNQLNKRRVNLYEPIWIHMESAGQPVQIVVNKISKNFVHGYISAPKYKAGELATTSASGTPAVTPAVEHPQQPQTQPQTPDPNSQPKQPEAQQPIPQQQQPEQPQPQPQP